MPVWVSPRWRRKACSMFKPQGARGQVLHQNDYYLKKTRSGECIAAWLAVDPSDEENGGLPIVPGTQDAAIFCPHQADPAVSFTKDEVDLPTGLRPLPLALRPGDVLVFNGVVAHGSFPNTGRDRFRRAFIARHVPASSQEMSRWHNPLLTKSRRKPPPLGVG